MSIIYKQKRLFVPGNHLHPNLKFAGARAYPRGALFRCFTLRYALRSGLPANIRLEWKDLSGTNTLSLSYYKHS